MIASAARRWLLAAALAATVGVAACSTPPTAASPYVPPAGAWAERKPAALGFDAARLQAAVELAQQKTVARPAELREVLLATYPKREPGYRILGPTGTRKGGSGLVIRHGYVAASWGDLHAAEMTFSVAKSFLATVAGLALADGKIGSLDERVGSRVRPDLFADAHNAPITWRHLLQQNSDWSGTLWDVPDWADRPEGNDPARYAQRELHEPGSHHKYNDVRVNLLALALLEATRRPLPDILGERVMQPIGASGDWRWLGYDNSWVDIDGRRVQSVSGGGHFGGGLFISTEDLARFGLLMLRDGRWGERQLVPAAWIAQAREPSPTRDDYGLLWWLNTGRKAIPAAPASAFWAAGFGGNYVYVDPEHDLVIVLRWVPDYADVVTQFIAALESGQS